MCRFDPVTVRLRAFNRVVRVFVLPRAPADTWESLEPHALEVQRWAGWRGGGVGVGGLSDSQTATGSDLFPYAHPRRREALGRCGVVRFASCFQRRDLNTTMDYSLRVVVLLSAWSVSTGLFPTAPV